MIQRQRWLLPILIVLMAGITKTAWGRPDSTQIESKNERTIFVGALNFDCYADTVKGWNVEGEDGYLPTRIIWGVPQQNNQGQLDSGCLGRTPLDVRVKQTQFLYSHADLRGGSVAFQRINHDSLMDVVMYLRTIDPNRPGRGPEGSATSIRSLVVFGQHGLDSIATIDVGEIDRFQAAPFFAMDLVIGSELTSPGIRDLSDQISYVLEPVNLDLDPDMPDSMPSAPRLMAATDKAQATVRIYPNPISNTVRVAAEGIQDGEYRIQLVSVNGDLVMQENVRLHPGESLQRTLDVQRIPNGYYVVRIESAKGATIGFRSVIIAR